MSSHRPPCRDFYCRHRRAVRFVVTLMAVSAFFFWLGTMAPHMVAPGMCRVYY